MAIKDEIQVIEMTWDDLCQNADLMNSPSWHENVLAGREEYHQRGVDTFVDWDVAKKKIKKQLHEN